MNQTTIPELWAQALMQLLEKTFWTWFQAFGVALVGSTFFDSLDWSVAAAAGVAVIPAAITVLVNAAIGASAPATWPPFAQLVFRVVRTWAATFLGFLAAAQWTLELTELRALVTAGIAAAGAAFLAALKAEAATHFGNRASTATLPARYDFALAA